jgi:BirA family transcriptional regulator, biotin operon repressor / biotin---[acetyl-CoA-carboxylase] ligase
VLRELARRYRGFVTAEGDPDGPTEATGLRSAYRSACVTLGRAVRVELPGDREVTGEAVDVDRSGRLLVRDEDGTTNALAAGDVAHVR